MKRQTKEKTSQLLEAQGILPMFSHEDEVVAKSLLQAAYEGGAKLVEFTNRSPKALKIFKNLKKHAGKHLPGLVLGAGTIMHAREAKAFIRAGADFIVAPIVDKGVAKCCADAGLLWCPGASTLTEIVHAQQLGSGMIKIFPAQQLGGPEFVRAVLAPCPWLPMMATGGVTTDMENLRAWFKAGVRCVGIGSHLFPADLVAKRDFAQIKHRIQVALQSILLIRKNDPNNA